MAPSATPFWRAGVEFLPGFLSEKDCEALVSAVENYRRTFDLPVVHREHRARSLHYLVVEGDRFDAVLPDTTGLLSKVRAQLEETCGCPLELIENHRAARNINITPPGGEYQWHYDRNLVTAVIYLNSVKGGETELYPNYRIRLPGARPVRLQRFLDWLFMTKFARTLKSGPTTIAPTVGAIVMMRGNKTLHSVRPVEGDRERVNLVLAFDRPGAQHAGLSLDAYLYTSGADVESE